MVNYNDNNYVQQWNSLTETERAFEQLGNTVLYQNIRWLQQHSVEMQIYRCEFTGQMQTAAERLVRP